MKNIRDNRPPRHDEADLPLFGWAAQMATPPLTSGGRYVHRRTGLPAAVANTIAELAGIGPERSR